LLWKSERQCLLKTALDAGITHFDTARMYGEGLAERELGQFLGGDRQRVTIGTKFGLPAVKAMERFPAVLYAHRAIGGIGRKAAPVWWSKRKRCVTRTATEKSLEQSLRALRTDYIDIFFLHEPSELDREAMVETMAYLEREKRNGKIRYLGLAGEATECAAFAQWAGGVFDVLQVRDSLEKREADCLAAIGKRPQITFGYLRAAKGATEANGDMREVMRQALARNREGVILVSSRKPARLQMLAELPGDERGGL
jgi:aryl-alcohol dehydrogenase-like predicted oxidoreductase